MNSRYSYLKTESIDVLCSITYRLTARQSSQLCQFTVQARVAENPYVLLIKNLEVVASPRLGCFIPKAISLPKFPNSLTRFIFIEFEAPLRDPRDDHMMFWLLPLCCRISR